jgi:hypothetical protein
MREACSARIARLLTVITTAFAWFFISNHCVLADMQHASQTEASCHQPCCGNQPPAKNTTESATECCKTLHATLSAAAKDFAGYDTSLFALQFYFVGSVIFTNDSRPVPVLELDTGPPFVHTFAESVLQRSILAHAPPLIV